MPPWEATATSAARPARSSVYPSALGAQYRRGYISPQEAQLGYVLTSAIVVLVASIAAGALFVRKENRTVEGPPGGLLRRVARRVAPGDRCQCGGTVRATAGQAGELLGCTGCNRWWSMDGRRIIQN